MNALKSYSSDEESIHGASPVKMNKTTADMGTNYDDVGMDISEESDNDQSEDQQTKQGRHTNGSNDGDKMGANDDAKSDRSSTKSDAGPTRSSVQERLMDLASGNSSSSDRGSRRPSHDEDRQSHRKPRSRSKSRERSKRRSPERRDEKRRSHHHESRRSRRSRSRSRERRRSRSRSRDRRSRSRSRERRRRSRSRSRERKRPIDLRKEAQQKLAALKASNPELTVAELLKRSMEAQAAEVQRQTGIALPSYYNPATMNPTKFAEQERKKKLLWGNKDKVDPVPAEQKPVLANSFVQVPRAIAPPSQPTNNPVPGVAYGSGQAALWASTKFTNDSDGKMAEKFRRLMGCKSGNNEVATNTAVPPPTNMAGPSHKELVNQAPGKSGTVDQLQRQESMFHNMEKQYEMARMATHTQRGFGLGFSSQPYIPK